MRAIWAIAWHDLRLWLRSPGLVAASILPALGMGLVVAALTLSIGKQPVVLVQEGHGPLAEHMTHLIEADDEAYLVRRGDRGEAQRALDDLRAAAVIVVPRDFDERVAGAD